MFYVWFEKEKKVRRHKKLNQGRPNKICNFCYSKHEITFVHVQSLKKSHIYLFLSL